MAPRRERSESGESSPPSLSNRLTPMFVFRSQLPRRVAFSEPPKSSFAVEALLTILREGASEKTNSRRRWLKRPRAEDPR